MVKKDFNKADTTIDVTIRNHSVRPQNFPKKVTFPTYPLISSRTYAYQGVRKVSFSENFAYILNEWSLSSSIVLRRAVAYGNCKDC